MPTAAILAGGRASRFEGRDKGALVVDGLSILERQIAELSGFADDIMLVGADFQGSAECRFRIVPDRTPGRGPLGGLDAALAAATDNGVVIVACDMPFVTGAFLKHLLDLTRDADAVVPRTERGYHPLCAAYTKACGPAVARRLKDGRFAMVDLLADLRVRALPIGEIEAFGRAHRLLANVNTPADYEAVETPQGHEA